MVHKVTVNIVDDLDGSPAYETVTFGLDGQTFHIDLNAEHAAQLRATLAPWTKIARRPAARRNSASATTGKPDGRRGPRRGLDYDPAAVRAWAASNGITVSPRGRISGEIVERFRAAGY